MHYTLKIAAKNGNSDNFDLDNKKLAYYRLHDWVDQCYWQPFVISESITLLKHILILVLLLPS